MGSVDFLDDPPELLKLLNEIQPILQHNKDPGLLDPKASKEHDGPSMADISYVNPDGEPFYGRSDPEDPEDSNYNVVQSNQEWVWEWAMFPSKIMERQRR